MALDSGLPRKLNYPLSRSKSPLVSGGDFDSPSSLTIEWSLEDNDERQTVTLTLSLNELIAIASAIDVGRDIAYGTESIELWQIWVRALNTMSLCQQIADCLNDTDSEARKALLEAIQKGQTNGLPIPDGIDEEQNWADTKVNVEFISPEDENACNEDIIGGFAEQVINFLDASAWDIMQALDESTDASEATSKLISAIPFLNQLPFDELLSFADMAVTQFGNNYFSAVTEESKDEAIDLLYCFIIENCASGFDLQKLAEFLSAHCTQDITLVSIQAWIALEAGYIYDSGTLQYDVWAMIVLFASHNISAFDIPSPVYMQSKFKEFMNDPNPDIPERNPECSTPDCELEANFRENQGCWEIDHEIAHDTGVWVEGEGFYAIPSDGGGASGVAIYRIFESMDTPSIVFNVTRETDQNCAVTVRWIGEGGEADHNLEELTSIGTFERSYAIPVNDVTKIWIIIYGGNNHEQYYVIRDANVTP